MLKKSGSTVFGDSADDTHTFIGNTISGSSTSTGSFGALQIPGGESNGIGLHIHDGGIFGASASPNPSAHALVIESTTNTGMTIHSAWFIKEWYYSVFSNR